jgi:hypothetical protein
MSKLVTEHREYQRYNRDNLSISQAREKDEVRLALAMLSRRNSQEMAILTLTSGLPRVNLSESNFNITVPS